MSTLTIQSPEAFESVLRACASTLHSVANYKLPPGVDRRLTYLSEHKESLAPGEREELLALVEFAEGRSLEKLQGVATLQRLAEQFPQITVSS